MTRTLLDPSKLSLLDLLKQTGGLSVDALVERSPLSKTTIRQHLLWLEEQALIARAYHRVGRGRPQLVYELTAGGHELYPSQEGRVLRELLQFLLDEGHASLVQVFFERYWAERRKGFEERLASSGEGKMAVLLKLLTEEGFMPEVTERTEGRLTLRECNCPFSQAVKATRLPCRLEAKFIQEVLGREATEVRLMPQGEPVCTYELRSEAPLEV